MRYCKVTESEEKAKEKKRNLKGSASKLAVTFRFCFGDDSRGDELMSTQRQKATDRGPAAPVKNTLTNLFRSEHGFKFRSPFNANVK